MRSLLIATAITLPTVLLAAVITAGLLHHAARTISAALENVEPDLDEEASRA